MRIRRWYFVAATVVTLMFIVTYHVLSNTPPTQTTRSAPAQKALAFRSSEKTEAQQSQSTCGPQNSSDARLLGQSCLFECIPHRTCVTAAECTQCKCQFPQCFHRCILNVCYCDCCEQFTEPQG